MHPKTVLRRTGLPKSLFETRACRKLLDSKNPEIHVLLRCVTVIHWHATEKPRYYTIYNAPACEKGWAESVSFRLPSKVRVLVTDDTSMPTRIGATFNAVYNPSEITQDHLKDCEVWAVGLPLKMVAWADTFVQIDELDKGKLDRWYCRTTRYKVTRLEEEIWKQ